MYERIRVRLTTDLTKYDNRCKEGAEGWTGAPTNIWASQRPEQFIGVYFDSGAQLDGPAWNG